MNTFTTTSTFTKTHAKYLASKVAADLKQMQIFYGYPSDEEIYDYIGEVVILMLNGYLDYIIYGFKKDGEWVYALRYNASWGDVASDEPSGRVSAQADTTDAKWGTFLSKSQKFYALLKDEQAKVVAELPIERGSGSETEDKWSLEKTYSSEGGALSKLTLKLK